MMRSMFTGVSGLRVHQTKMDVIANNIANVNTVGFKSSRMTFQDTFSQTLSGATRAAADGTKGGTNPTQIGLGVKVGGIDSIMSGGISQRTDGAYDCMIDGEGFFIVSDASGQYFTRAGAFRFDEEGNFTNNEGLFVNGWAAVEDLLTGERSIKKGTVAPINIGGKDDMIEATETSYIRAGGNLNAATEPIRETNWEFYDTLGNLYALPVTMAYNATNKEWDVQVANYITTKGADGKDTKYEITIGAFGAGVAVVPPDKTSGALASDGGITIKGLWDPAPPTSSALTPVTIGQMKYDDKGHLLSTSPDSYRFTMTDPAKILAPNASFATKTIVNVEDVLQQNGVSNASFVMKNGNKPGSLQRISIGASGEITGLYTNGESKLLAQMSIALFKNPPGLERVGNNLFVATRNSGEFNGNGVAANEIGSSIMGGVLEMANVDLANEFTEMITTQRGFQANSRTISTSDEMLQELVNLKR